MNGMSRGDWIALGAITVTLGLALAGGFLKLFRELVTNTAITKDTSRRVTRLEIIVDSHITTEEKEAAAKAAGSAS